MKPIIVNVFDYTSVVAVIKFAKDIIQSQEFIFVIPNRIPGRTDQEFMYNICDILSIYLIGKGHRVSAKLVLSDMTNDVMYINTRDDVSAPCVNCQSILYNKLYEISKLYNTPNILIGNYNLPMVFTYIKPYYEKKGINLISPCQEFDNKRIEQLYNKFCTSYDLRVGVSEFNKCVVNVKEIQDVSGLIKHCNELFKKIESLNNKGGI